MEVCIKILPQKTFNITYLKLVDASNFDAFNGFCRFGSGGRDLINTTDANTFQDCYNECKIKNGCTAFAYTDSGDPTMACDLYRRGHYTEGSGKASTTCYIMPKSNSILSYNHNQNHYQ